MMEKTARKSPNGLVTPVMIESDRNQGFGSNGLEKQRNSVKLLVFDMGHVFIDFEWEAVCQGFCDYAGISRDEFKPIIKHLGALGYERGDVTTEQFKEELSKMLRKEISHSDFARIWNSTFRENEEMANLLQALRKQGYILYLLSNTNEVHYHFLQSTFNVARHFDEQILSYQVGAQKPEPAIYLEVIRRSGLHGSEIGFVDDLPANIAAGQAAGFRHNFLFTGAANLKLDFQKEGIRV